MKRKDFEVMAPVGSYESLEAALQAGANSVYFGVEDNPVVVTGCDRNYDGQRIMFILEWKG